MGLLSQGSPLSWEETRRYAEHVRQHGILQFLHIYRALRDRHKDVLKWGDEVGETPASAASAAPCGGRRCRSGAVRVGPWRPRCPERARPRWLGGRGRCGLPGGALFTSRTHTRSPRFVAQYGRPAVTRGSQTLEQLSVFPPGTSRLPGQPFGMCIPGAVMLGSTRSFPGVCLCSLDVPE